MGLKLEFNTVLALRPVEKGHTAEESIPADLQVGMVYSFLKKGYRVYPLNKPIPLMTTSGNQNFGATLAMVEISSIIITSDKGEEITLGTYSIKELL